MDADVVVVGAGMSGLYALKVLREQGLRVVVLEKGAGVGGTWFWNRYPGARCDIPSLEYSFGFDPDLEQEWEWTEHFASQPEIERYLNHLADRYDLRRDIRLSTGVVAMTFDEDADTWTFDTDTGEQLTARFAVMATGGLSAPNTTVVAGDRHLRGHASCRRACGPRKGWSSRASASASSGRDRRGCRRSPSWPRSPQHLTVFQRTAAFTWPSRNQPLSADEQAAIKARYRQLRRGAVRVVQRHRGDHRRGDLRVPERRAAHPREHAGGA